MIVLQFRVDVINVTSESHVREDSEVDPDYFAEDENGH
jgi:hypothetical protein